MRRPNREDCGIETLGIQTFGLRFHEPHADGLRLRGILQRDTDLGEIRPL